MPLPDVLCDASVVLKWFHAEGEQEVDESRDLLDLHRRRAIAVSVLDLTAYEVANALLRGRRASVAQVAAVLEALDVVCPRIAPTVAEMTEAVALAERHGLTVYDAAYAATAAGRHLALATLDRALLEAGLGRRPSELL